MQSQGGLLSGGQGSGRSAPVAPPAPPPVPSTDEQLQALIARREELQEQLEDVVDRQEELVDQFNQTHPELRTGFSDRMDVLNARTTRLEQELQQIDNAIAAGVGAGLQRPEDETHTEVQVFSDPFPAEAVGPIVGGSLLFLLLVAFLTYRIGWARAKSKFSRGITEGSGQRMDQLQHAVDAIAVEVERISEGQRYVTNLLNDRSLEAGRGEELRVGRKGV
jgi:hypothetical protein